MESAAPGLPCFVTMDVIFGACSAATNNAAAHNAKAIRITPDYMHCGVVVVNRRCQKPAPFLRLPALGGFFAAGDLGILSLIEIFRSLWIGSVGFWS